MAYGDFDRLVESFIREVSFWKPSEQAFEETLAKAKAWGNVPNIRLLPQERQELLGIYQRAALEELAQKAGK